MINKEIVDIFAKGALHFSFLMEGQNICRSLYKCKNSLNKKDLFLYPDIDKDSVIYHVRREFKIPYEEEILLVRDTSFWNKKNQGVVISDWGIRVRPDNDSADIYSVSWKELETIDCIANKEKDISLYFRDINGIRMEVNTYELFWYPEFPYYPGSEEKAKAILSFYQSLASLFNQMVKVQMSDAQKMLEEYKILKSNNEANAMQIAQKFRCKFHNNLLTGDIANWYYYNQNRITDAIKILDEDIDFLTSCLNKNIDCNMVEKERTISFWQRKRAELRMHKYKILRDNGNHLQARKDCLSIIRDDIPMEFLNDESKELQKCAEKDFKVLEQNYVEHFFDLPYVERKLIVPVNSYSDLSQKSVTLLDIHNLPVVNFGIGHPKVNQLYVGHPYVADHYIPFENYELALLEDKIREFCQVMQFLGATEINIESVNSSSSNKSINVNQKGSVNVDYKLASGNVDFNRDASSKFLEDISRSISLHQKFTPKNSPTLPSNLIWYPNEPTWHRIYAQRMQGGFDEHEERIETKKSQVVDKSELVQVAAEMKKLIIQAKGNWEQSMEEKYEAHENAVLSIRVKFAPLENLQEKKSLNDEVNKVKDSLKGYFNTAKDKIKGAEKRILSIGKTLENNEEEYLEELKACLEEDTEISPRERRLLNRIREKLGISEERAAELEASLMQLQLTEEEQEYLEEYKAYLEEDGEITPKARRMLDRFRNRLDISEERTLEIEKY